MRVELLPGMTNVVRFPLERRARPTLELLRGVAPDVREVLNVAEAFGMAMPVPDLRERVDAATAEHIANQIPAGGAAREAMLCELIEPVVAGAIASCREAHDAWAGAAAAEETLRRARRAGYFRIDSVQERAAALTWRAAELMMIAHMRAEEAEGVARAVGLARSGEAWRPRDVRGEAEELFRFAAWRRLTCGNAERSRHQAVAGLAVGQAVEIMAVRHRRALNQLVRCVPVEPAAAWSLMSIGPRNAVEPERRLAAGRPRSGGHSFRASRTIRRKSSSSL